MYIVSRCLLGHECKYDGDNNRNEDVIEFCKNHDYVTICPEAAGGLEAPRQPAEIVVDENGNRKVIDKDGKDLTSEFEQGSYWSLQSVILEAGSMIDGSKRIEGAILKDNSPSCGAGTVYDGTFTGTMTEGNGIFVDKLIEAYLNDGHLFGRIDFAENFKICNENNFKNVFGDR
ncbi:MAG: DUF523 domain-containing protein [Clostridiales bacterium]|nr:DUF523 domain-containing protein [Clostridiales bacterium]